MYRCSSSFECSGLEDLFTVGDAYGLIVLDVHEACWGIVKNGNVTPLGSIDSYVPGKHSQGGQSAQRFERNRDIAINAFFVKVGEMASLSLMQFNLKGLAIGGCGLTKKEFARGNYLHHELKKKFIGEFDTCYTNEYGLTELYEVSRKEFSDRDAIKYKEEFEEFLKVLAKDTERCVYGDDIKRDGVYKILITTRALGTRELVENGTKIVIIPSELDVGSIIDKTFGGAVGITR